MFPIAEGKDPDKIWDYWVNVHSTTCEDYEKTVNSLELTHKDDKFAEIVAESTSLAFIEEKVIIE